MCTLRKFALLLDGRRAVLTLHQTKSGKRKGSDEMVVVTSGIAIKALHVALASLSPSGVILRRSPYKARGISKEF